MSAGATDATDASGVDAATGAEPDPATSLEPPCALQEYEVSDELTIAACEGEFDVALGASLATPSTPSAAAKGKRLKNCEFRSIAALSKTLGVLCPAEKHVVSGGCQATVALVSTAPFENSVVANLPEHTEKYQDTAIQSGWACTRGGDPFPGTVVSTTAFCCE